MKFHLFNSGFRELKPFNKQFINIIDYSSTKGLAGGGGLTVFLTMIYGGH